MYPMKFIVESLEDLDTFDYDEVLAQDHTGTFEVFCEETQTLYVPSWCIRPNGDIDGLEGWNKK